LTCYDTSWAPDRCRVPHTGRGSDSLVLIEAGGFYPKFYSICMLQLICCLAGGGTSAARFGHA